MAASSCRCARSALGLSSPMRSNVAGTDTMPQASPQDLRAGLPGLQMRPAACPAGSAAPRRGAGFPPCRRAGPARRENRVASRQAWRNSGRLPRASSISATQDSPSLRARPSLGRRMHSPSRLTPMRRRRSRTGRGQPRRLTGSRARTPGSRSISGTRTSCPERASQSAARAVGATAVISGVATLPGFPDGRRAQGIGAAKQPDAAGNFQQQRTAGIQAGDGREAHRPVGEPAEGSALALAVTRPECPGRATAPGPH